MRAKPGEWQEQSLRITASMLKSGTNEVGFRALGEQDGGMQGKKA